MKIENKLIEEKVRKLVKPVIERMGYRLFDVEFKPERGWVLRIIADKEGGITIKDCEEISKKISALLDVEDIIPFSYFLEVSSPGLDRELTKPEHYEFFVGRLAKFILREPIEGKREIKAYIEGISEGIVIVKTEEGDKLHVPLSYIARARLEF